MTNLTEQNGGGQCLSAADIEFLERKTEFHRRRLRIRPTYQPQDDPRHISNVIAEYLASQLLKPAPALHEEVAGV